MLHVVEDRDGWFRIARRGRILTGKRNVYFTRTGAMAAVRAIRRQRGGEHSASLYLRA